MIYGLTNSKGGVGKTTIAVHLAAWLAHKKNRSVLFIDADPQQSASPWISKLNIPLEQRSSDKAIIQRVSEADEKTDIVIDGPAGLSELTKAMMLVCDRVFMPCTPSLLDLQAAIRAVQLLERARKTRNGEPHALIIPNRLQKRGRLSRQMLEIADTLGIPMAKGLSQRQAFPDSAGRATVVWEMGAGAFLAANEMQQLMKEITRG